MNTGGPEGTAWYKIKLRKVVRVVRLVGFRGGQQGQAWRRREANNRQRRDDGWACSGQWTVDWAPGRLVQCPLPATLSSLTLGALEPSPQHCIAQTVQSSPHLRVPKVTKAKAMIPPDPDHDLHLIASRAKVPDKGERRRRYFKSDELKGSIPETRRRDPAIHPKRPTKGARYVLIRYRSTKGTNGDVQEGGAEPYLP